MCLSSSVWQRAQGRSRLEVTRPGGSAGEKVVRVELCSLRDELVSGLRGGNVQQAQSFMTSANRVAQPRLGFQSVETAQLSLDSAARTAWFPDTQLGEETLRPEPQLVLAVRQKRRRTGSKVGGRRSKR